MPALSDVAPSPITPTPIEIIAFSPQQSRVIAGIVDNLDYREIAARLDISEHTVQTYVQLVAARIRASSVDLPDLPPRWLIYFYASYVRWHDEFLAALESQAAGDVTRVLAAR